MRCRLVRNLLDDERFVCLFVSLTLVYKPDFTIPTTGAYSYSLKFSSGLLHQPLTVADTIELSSSIRATFELAN
jgi:hypothetical protein